MIIYLFMQLQLLLYSCDPRNALRFWIAILFISYLLRSAVGHELMEWAY